MTTKDAICEVLARNAREAWAAATRDDVDALAIADYAPTDQAESSIRDELDRFVKSTGSSISTDVTECAALLGIGTADTMRQSEMRGEVIPAELAARLARCACLYGLEAARHHEHSFGHPTLLVMLGTAAHFRRLLDGTNVQRLGVVACGMWLLWSDTSRIPVDGMLYGALAGRLLQESSLRKWTEFKARAQIALPTSSPVVRSLRDDPDPEFPMLVLLRDLFPD